jgi:hypothetical protein
MAEEAAQGVENLNLAADGGKKNRIQVSNTKRPVRHSSLGTRVSTGLYLLLRILVFVQMPENRSIL